MSDRQTDTTARLKADIDSGRTGDKVRAPDPGLSPLGTDDEAAGTPASPEAIAMARDAELSRDLHTPQDTKSFNSMWIIAIVGVFAVFAAGFAWLVH